MKMHSLFICLIATMVVLVVNCSQTPVQSGPSETPVITGKLMKSDGTTPASGAIVTLLPRDAVVSIGGPAKRTAAANKITVQTTTDGSFVIGSCTEGVYALEGVDTDGNAIRLDSVVVSDPTITTDVAQQALQSTGALQGRVFLDNGGSPENVFILVFGSDRFMQVNSDGSYLMTDLPYGNYTLKFVCVLKECGLSKTISVTVAPGTTKHVDDITLSVPEVCVPGSAKITYDSIRMAVSLEWDACADEGIAGYNIYRYNTAEADQYPQNPFCQLPVTSTSYTDYNVEMDKQYVYGIASVSVNGSISRKTDPLSATAVCSAFTVDSLIIATNYLIFGVYFDSDDRLLVATSEQKRNDDGNLSYSFNIDIYRSDLSFDRRIVVSDSMYEIHHCILRDDYCVVSCEIPIDARPATMVRWDNRIHSFSYTGEKRYTTVFNQAEVLEFAERNDTLYVMTDSRSFTDNGELQIAAYDTTGTPLFDIYDSYDMVCASDGNLYNLESRTDLATNLHTYVIQQYSLQTQSFSDVVTILQEGLQPFYRRIETNNGLYYLSGSPALAVFDNNGTLLSRFNGGYRLGWFPETFSVNSQGYIALPYMNRVILLKPRNN